MTKPVFIDPVPISQSEIKGLLFERRILRNFPIHDYILHDWRGDKKSNVQFPQSSLRPDFVLELMHEHRRTFFAIECKWRGKWMSNKPWATRDQRECYGTFARRLRMPVHVAIGISGSPDNPARQFLIPFDLIEFQDFIELDHLQPFEWPDGPIALRKYIVAAGMHIRPRGIQINNKNRENLHPGDQLAIPFGDSL